MKRWPLFAVSAGALVLIAVRIIWPLLKFDSTSLILFGIAALAMLVAFLPIKRIKWGEFEAEIDRAVDDLERKVTATEASPPTLPISKMPGGGSEFFDEYMALVTSPTSNVEKIVAATVLLEKMIDTFSESLGQELGAKGRGPRSTIEALATHNLITTQEKAAFMDLWEVHNKIVHQGIRPTNEQTARLLDLVWRLVRTLGG